MKPTIYLIPSLLGNGLTEKSITQYNVDTINKLWHFVVENEKSARRFIKQICPKKPQSELKIQILNKHTPQEELHDLLAPIYNSNSIGIISEAGMPVIADPGSRLVNLAHQKNIKVEPLVGASSIPLALVASGFNGQSFSFNGYLPIEKHERRKKIQELENKSRNQGSSSEIFMETPYRNNTLFSDLLKTLKPNTRLCVACDITLPTEFIFSGTPAKWKQIKEDFHKRPAIFIIQAG